MKHPTESLEHASVRQYCKAVRVPVIAAKFLTLAEQAVKENHSHVHYSEALLAMESEERDRHAIQSRIRDAQLPRMKTLEKFDFGQAPRIPAARVRELRRRIHRSQRAGGLHWRVRHRQDSPGDGLVRSRRLPAKAARPVHDGGSYW